MIFLDLFLICDFLLLRSKLFCHKQADSIITTTQCSYSYVHVTYTHTNTYALTYIHIWVPYLSCSTCPPRALPQTVPLPSPPIPLVPVFVSGNAAIVIVVVVCSLVATSLELHADFSFQEIFLTAVDWDFNFFNMQKKRRKKNKKCRQHERKL